jgi:hypothetical protein
LQVVDRDHERAVLREHVEAVANRKSERARIDDARRGVLDQERAFECTPTRRRQPWKDVGECTLDI